MHAHTHCCKQHQYAAKVILCFSLCLSVLHTQTQKADSSHEHLHLYQSQRSTIRDKQGGFTETCCHHGNMVITTSSFFLPAKNRFSPHFLPQILPSHHPLSPSIVRSTPHFFLIILSFAPFHSDMLLKLSHLALFCLSGFFLLQD